MVKRIPLTQGKYAIVDDEDYEQVNQYKWLAQRKGPNWYASRQTGGRLNQRTIYLHRFILYAPSGVLVDHKNGDGLDCRRANMRLCNRAQNGQNRGFNCNNKSGLKGVAWSKIANRWVAQIMVDGKRHHLGYFTSPEDAALAYDEAARKYHGKFAWVNFPITGKVE